MDLLRRSLAEAVGTFALVFVGCGAVVVEAQTGALGHVGVSLSFAAVIGVMIFATGHICGAHFNPAVSVAFASIGAFPWRDVPAYVGAQIAAALAGAGAVRVLIGDEAALGSTSTSLGLGQAFAIEVGLSFFLMFVITSVATDARAASKNAALAIGGTVGLAALMGGPLTGASMNPARSLGPALVAGQLADIWLYLAAPVLGALLGAFAYRFVQAAKG